MTLLAPTYDLVLLLDPEAEEATRQKILADTRAAIEAEGEFLRHDGWGDRALTYPIDRKAVAEYHLLQFHAGAPELLSGLDRTLRITDGIVRFRIIKLKPGVPEAPAVLGAPERQVEEVAEAIVAEAVLEAEAEAVVEEAEADAIAEAVVEAVETEAIVEAEAEAVVEEAEADAIAEAVVEAVETEAIAEEIVEAEVETAVEEIESEAAEAAPGVDGEAGTPA
jgi:small subunit ribosomal protein S6